MAIRLDLHSISVFRFVDKKLARHIPECCRIITKSREEAILMKGEDVPGIYIVASGNVEIHAGSSSGAITLIGEGDVFGEMSLIERTTASATVRAHSDETTMVLVNGDMFRSKLDEIPALAAGFFKGMALPLADRLRASTDKIGREIELRHKSEHSLSGQGTIAATIADLDGDLEVLADMLREVAGGQRKAATVAQDGQDIVRRLQENATGLRSLVEQLRGDLRD